jgi:cyclic pyranopterin phosphate synthase
MMPALLVQASSTPEVSFRDAPVSPALRRLRLLRLSVTDLCNFRCLYCMPGNGVLKLAHSDLLSFEALTELVRWLSCETGINRVRITGGEPLVRPGIEHLIRQLSSFPSLQEISLTTNGTLLPQMAHGLKAAGLSRVNISLDSLSEARFAQVTRGGQLKRTLDGIGAAKEAGLTPIKLNTVLQRSTWKQEVPCLLDYAADCGLEIRFIELMRTGTERAWCDSEFISVAEVCRELSAEILSVEDESRASARKTTVKWRGTLVNVGWITPRSHPFCAQCERLRMDARGRVRRCLMDPTTLDLPRVLSTMNSADAQHEFRTYIAGKVPPRTMDSALAMSQIGG